MSRRAAETLVEVVTAMTLFGVLLGGIFDFMGGQSQYVTKLGYHSKIMYGMQQYINNIPLDSAKDWKDISSKDEYLGVKYYYTSNTLKAEAMNHKFNTDRDRVSFTFSFPLKPSK